jgi:hypothetical protein
MATSNTTKRREGYREQMERIANEAFRESFTRMLACAAESSPDSSTTELAGLYIELMQNQMTFWCRRARSQGMSSRPALRLVVDNTRARKPAPIAS